MNRMIPIAFERRWFRWHAYRMLEVPVHLEECDDPECRGALMRAADPFVSAFTAKGARQKAAKILTAERLGEEQRQRSESLGG
ncbi:hypothetical protein PBI_DEWDROP_12 [Microbacterium phage Dewdrop]|nr:hypothetical protein PBI_LEAF_12 [Microbacterium phage Leaf]QGZ17381.1 hypothetical protein PBI_DEWDROP_12 [Microbacterium phage Dewdrop]